LAAVDLAFLIANLVKVPHGGWFPLLYGAAVLVVMRTWRKGRRQVDAQLEERSIDWAEFVDLVRREAPRRVPGVAVFVEGDAQRVPASLVRNILSNGSLHEHTILFAVATEPVPRVSRGQRLAVEKLDFGIRRVRAHLGYMESPDVPKLLHDAERFGLGARARDAFYVLEREDVVLTAARGMSHWRKLLFLFLARNARGMAARLRIPPERGITLGGQVAV
jgi:KUP system potassium uptake protein